MNDKNKEPYFNTNNRNKKDNHTQSTIALSDFRESIVQYANPKADNDGFVIHFYTVVILRILYTRFKFFRISLSLFHCLNPKK